VNYNQAYTGGINILGGAWGRPEDNIGIAYGHLRGGNLDVDHTHVAEVYYPLVAHKYVAITADVQYLRDKYQGGGDTSGFVFGLRGTIKF
jgi:hypothetical protein